MYSDAQPHHDEYHLKLFALMDLVEKRKPVFVMGGEVFRGNHTTLAREYVTKNPSKKFRTWLIDKGLLIGNYKSE